MKVISKYNFSLREIITIILTVIFLFVILILNISEQIVFHKEDHKVFTKTLQ